MSKRSILFLTVTLLLIIGIKFAVPYLRPTAPMSTQSVRFYLKLSDSAWGTEAERERLMDFDEQLATRFASKQPFEYDGHERGEGFFTMFFYGPSADGIISTVQPILAGFGIPPGSYLVRRNGNIGTPEQKHPL